MNNRLLKRQIELCEARVAYALATVVEVLGSSSAKPSAKALFDEQGKLITGWIGGGCAQAMVGKTALNCISTGEPDMIEVDLNDEVFGAGMPCGGHMRVYVEPVLPNPTLWLMGHGRIVETLCSFANRLGFDVIVNDAIAELQAFPDALRVVNDDIRYSQLNPKNGDYVVIASHHKGDFDSLSRAIRSPARYIALVSSRKRARLVLDRLGGEGFSEEELGKVHAPAGLDLGAKLPEEIALSVLSEMVMVRREGKGGAMNDIR